MAAAKWIPDPEDWREVVRDYDKYLHQNWKTRALKAQRRDT